MTDNWDSYLCEVDGKPASIIVDLGAVAEAPMLQFPYFGHITLLLQNPDENGFPGREEYLILADMEDALVASMTEENASVHIGCCITDGRYELIFYTHGQEGWRRKTTDVLASFPDREWDASAHYEPNWDTYLGFLFPGEHDLLAIQNRRLCRRLTEEGDDLSTIRPISHWLDFADSESGELFCQDISEQGFFVETFLPSADQTTPTEDTPNGDGPADELSQDRSNVYLPTFQVRLSRADAPENIDEISFTLMELAAEHGGEYQGWSCSIPE